MAPPLNFGAAAPGLAAPVATHDAGAQRRLQIATARAERRGLVVVALGHSRWSLARQLAAGIEVLSTRDNLTLILIDIVRVDMARRGLA